MHAGWFRGHKSSNRIELSQFVPDIVFLLIQASSALRGGGGAGWGKVHGVTSINLYMFRTFMCVKHGNIMQMEAQIGGIPGNSL